MNPRNRTLSLKIDKQFKKDFKSCQKSGRDLNKLQLVIEELKKGTILHSKYKKHRLRGKYNNCSECHIEPDWLLIWAIEGNTLRLIRTGSHSNLF